METTHKQQGPNFWFAVALITLGVLFLLNNFDIINLGDLWDYWPLIFIAIGLSKLKSSDYHDKSSAVIFLLLGIVFLLTSLDILAWRDIWQFWPIMLIAMGISIILRRSHSEDSTRDISTEDRLDVVAVFSGHHKLVVSKNFQGGTVSTLFGGAKLDLGKAELAPGEQVLNVFCMFGGAELHLPKTWKVVIKGVPVFGGFDDARVAAPPEDENVDRQLVIKGYVIFGGLELKSSALEQTAV